MSWFSSNYDKALLVAGALIAVIMLYFGWSRLQGSDVDFSKHLMGGGKLNAGVDGAEKIAQAMQSKALDHGWKPGDFESREVDLFTGIPLFIQRDKADQALDLLKGPQVHPPIDNAFWLQYRIDPGFADSPQRDPDGDGFSNLEEFNDGSDPTDPDDHPPLLDKLRFVQDVTVSWLLKPGFLGQEGTMPMKYEDTKGFKNNASAANPVKPGQLFFANGAAQGRFKYLGHVKKEQMNPAINVMEEITLARIEDQKANKIGVIYEIPAPLKTGQKSKFIQHDRSAVMKLEALGQGGKEMIIEENTRFSLPAGKEEKPYLLKSVEPGKITVEYTDSDGQKRTDEILKGALRKP